MGLLVALSLSACIGAGNAPRVEESVLDPFDDFASTLSATPRTPAAIADRLALLNLIHFYSHVADGLHTELFGEFFTEDARFLIAPSASPETSASVDRQTIGVGREAIVASLAPRHEQFRANGVQRRHFLTNPVVWNQTELEARVGVYLQLRSSTRGGPSEIVGTGRYEGRAVKTREGWRMAEWTIFSDQIID